MLKRFFFNLIQNRHFMVSAFLWDLLTNQMINCSRREAIIVNVCVFFMQNFRLNVLTFRVTFTPLTFFTSHLAPPPPPTRLISLQLIRATTSRSRAILPMLSRLCLSLFPGQKIAKSPILTLAEFLIILLLSFVD